MQRVERPFPRRRGSRRGRLVIVLGVLLFVVSISSLVKFYTDLLWYREVGYASVFWTILWAKVVIGAIFGVGFFLFSLANLLIVTRLMPTYRTAIDPDDPLERYRGAFVPYVRWIAIGISAFLGFMFALTATPAWERVLLALNRTSFGETDLVFQREIGFYVFRLPFYEFLYQWLFSGLVVVIIIVAVAHYLTGGIRPQSPGDRVTPQVKAHLSALIGVLILLYAWGYRLKQFDLLFSTRGDVTGASYTDINAEKPALTLLIVIAVIVAALFLVNIRRKGWALPVAGAALWLIISVLGRGLFPYFIERFSVAPSPLQKERPYIQRSIEATRKAYGLDAIELRDHPAQPGITQAVIDANPQTVNNIRLWDPATLSTTYRRLQEIRQYYRFEDVDVDRYSIDGTPRQMMLSVRELAPQEIPTESWLNLHVVYTHGYGAVVSPTNESNPEGEPSLLAQDIPPKTSVPELELEQPGVYFGEVLGDIEYSLVRTTQRELDYGTPEGNVYTTYEGRGGVRASGLLRRLAFAWRFRNVNLAISSLIQDESRILYYRNIKDRLNLAAPFIRFDGDPYPVIEGGRIVWMADGYTVSSMYPYSERLDFGERTTRRSVDDTTLEPSITGRHNYIRNSIKATVDAYDGTVRLYVWDEKDPVLRAWREIFPDLFTDGDEMPEGLREHVRYPEDLFRIQSHVYLRYHMTDATEFFTNEDLWKIPADPTIETSEVASSVLEEIQPYYVLMRLPGSDKLEYLLILPVNPAGRERQNMVAFLAAQSDPDNYGELLDYRFPKGRQIDGVGLIFSRINGEPSISQRRTLLGQQGSRVKFGNLLVIPMGESILYSQPLFLQAQASPLPELKNVILATGERVVMGTSLDDALKLLLAGGPVVSEEVERELEEVDPTRQLITELRAALDALNAGDLAEFGRRMESVEQALERAEAAQR